jgi:acyl-coenzyme A synthetase/AMP-(fatty) acid ligase
LRDWLVDEYITIAYAPTALAERLIALEWPRHTALRTLLTGGDILRQYPRAGLPFKLANHYGPTEAAGVVTSGEVSPQSNPVELPSVGGAIDNVRLAILDESMKLARHGKPGELYIGGPGVARGYVNQPELTAHKFMSDLFCADPYARLYRTGDLVRRLADGQIAFLGRVDDRLTIRGYRVEPSEIETALNAHPQIANSAAIVREDLPGERRLVAYVAPAAGAAPSPAAVERWLRDRLPEYMHPSAIVCLCEIPLTLNGSVDRDALPAPHRETEPSAREEMQARLAQIVAALLEVDDISHDDNFFEAGAHPLLAALLLDRVRQVFGVTLTAEQIFDAPTVGGLAAEIERAAMLSNSSQ